jgi:hypothetical protein
MKSAVMILTHGRPDRVLTYDTLLKYGYTGEVIIVADNEDKTIAGYKSKFGDKVHVFDKEEWAAKTDVCDNFPHRKAIVYARNACFQIAKERGVSHFIQMDDDYHGFYGRFTGGLEYKATCIHSQIDGAIKATFDFLDTAKQVKAMAWAQGGDFMGGDGNQLMSAIRFKRKCMNSWFCLTDRPIQFSGHMNEDASAYILGGLRGDLFLTTFFFSIEQVTTQAASGGMTDVYLDNGTYVKTFYSIIQSPSCVKVSTLGRTDETQRHHHKIDFQRCAPKILRESVRKP